MRITAVSYLNTKPFIYGIYRSALADRVELSLDIPSVCASKLLSGAVDLALTPVAIIPELPEAHLVSDYCIGSTGKVKTVCIYADQPLPTIKKLCLDFHSRTSVELTRILCAQYWHINPEFVAATPGFETALGGDTAGLVIGDRTIGLDQRYEYVYDLGEAWTAWTGLPFVYAAWISTRPLPAEFIAEFNEALRSGLDHLPELAKIIPTLPGLDVEDYFRHNISYELDEPKWMGLQRFLGLMTKAKGYKLYRKLAVPA